MEQGTESRERGTVGGSFGPFNPGHAPDSGFAFLCEHGEDNCPRCSGARFAAFQNTNRRRCEEAFGHRVAWDEPSWPLENWALAICGEAGELANLVKKCLRGDFTVQEKRGEILDELADVITYCDLAISSLGADTGETVWAKFRKVSDRVGWFPPPHTPHASRLAPSLIDSGGD